jgi:hypothetical protein
MTAVILFKGWPDPWHPTDSLGFNKTGYVTDAGVVIYPRRGRIARTTIDAVTRRHNYLIDLSKRPRAAQIETFFTNNLINNTLYVAAMQEIGDPDSPFWNNPVKIPILEPISVEEHEARWIESIGALQKGDLLFTVDTRNIISRMITYFDQGAWSHTATYVGNGRIVEASSSEVVERSIEAYLDPHYRSGVYRLPAATPEQIDAYIAVLRSTVGDRYSYLKVLLVALRLALGIWPSGAARHTTPNMLITRARLDLVKIV